MPSTEPFLDADSRRTLRQIAAASIAEGLTHRRGLEMVAADYAPALQAARATFVTLYKGGELRGCIGTLEARRPLVADVAYNAFAAAFRDPRFLPVQSDEIAVLDLHISVLGLPEPLRFVDQDDLLAQLRPGLDGLILERGSQRGTFLPSVWESLPQPDRFLAHLKVKAGLAKSDWSPDIRVWRYTTETF